MKSKTISAIIAIVVAVTLVSCSGTRNLTKAKIQMPETLAPAPADGATTYNDTLSAADMKWWEFYTDPALCHILQRTIESNKDLLIASARIEELRQLYGVDKLNYLPTFSAIVGETNETNDYYGEKFKRDPEISFKGTVNWEVNLWGGLSQAQKKSRATFLQSVENRRALQVSLIAEAATAYFNLVALINELEIVNQTLETRREALEKSRLRYEGGLTSEIVYQQAKVELASAEALVPGLERRIKLARNAINLLMGELPDAPLNVTPAPLNNHLPPNLPAGIPSALLERRPDLRASELALQTAMADAGIAYSNQFPNLRLSLTGGWENDSWTHLFQSPFSYILGNIAGTIFDFGRNHRKYKSKVAAYDQARLRYEKDVLTAFSETYDASIAYDMLRVTTSKRVDLCDAAFKYVDLANKQYLAGSINYIDVLDAQRRYFDARISLSNAIRDQYLALVTLYKVLGGGWQE